MAYARYNKVYRVFFLVFFFLLVCIFDYLKQASTKISIIVHS
jgi:hypothetical protein